MSRLPVSVKAVLLDPSDRVVLLRNERAEWELPGGKLEPGEQPCEVVERELREELEVRVRCGPILDSWVFEVHPGQEVLIVTYAAVAESLSGLRHSAEHHAVGLFTLAEAERLPIPAGYLASVRRWLDHPRPRGEAGEGASSAATLHLLAGPWGSGKSSLVPHLARLLPEVVVFDWDVVLPGLSAAAGVDAHREPSTWEGLRLVWVAIAGSALAGGRDVLLCGPATPADLAGSGVAASPVRCAYLDCPDRVLAERLRDRGVAEAEIAGELGTMRELRGSGHHPVRVGDRTPAEIAGEVAAWVRAGRPAAGA